MTTRHRETVNPTGGNAQRNPHVPRPDLFAYAAGVTSLVAAALLIGFFVVEFLLPPSGMALGTANDLTGSLSTALMIPVAIAVGVHLPRSRLARLTQVAGIGAMVVLTAAGPALVFGVLDFAVQMPIATAAGWVLLVWVIVLSRAMRRSPSWSQPAQCGRAVMWLAAVGLATIAVAWLLAWLELPFQVLFGAGLAVGLIAWLGIPAWFLLVGRQFAREREARSG